jgi:hypothetical protein
MKVIRISGIGRFHRYIAPLATTQWMSFIDDTSMSGQFEEPIPNAGAAKEWRPASWYAREAWIPVFT